MEVVVRQSQSMEVGEAEVSEDDGVDLDGENEKGEG